MSREGGEDEGEADDDPTADLGGLAPTYEEAPPTLDTFSSPFHPRSAVSSLKPTTPGMPALIVPAPRLSVAVLVPVVVGTPEDMAGPTDPDGYAITSSGEGGVIPTWIDAPATEPTFAPAPARPAPEVPRPGAATFEISKSLEMDSAKALELAKVAKKPPRAKRPYHVPQSGPGAHAPTYQMLPALKRKPEREGSDWPLVLGLVGLFVLIALLVGAVAYGIVSRPTPPPAPAAPAEEP